MLPTKEKFVEAVEKIREVVESDECKDCSCPNIRCELHGDCYNCVRVYRFSGSHVPRCLQFILEKKVSKITECAEDVVQKRPKTPDSYYDYLNATSPKQKV